MRATRQLNVTSTLANENPAGVQSPTPAKCEVATGLNSEVAFILVSTILLAVSELCKLVITPKLYIRSWMNIGTWILIALVLATTIPNLTKQSSIGPYQHQAAAV